MDKGMKNILIILGVFCFVSLITAVKFFKIERATYRQYLQVKSENVKLDGEVSSLNQEKSKLTTELGAVRKELREISRKEEELRREYVSIINEREELSLQVEELIRGKEELEKKISGIGSGGFLSRVLKEKIYLEVKVENLKEKLKKTDELAREIEAAAKERAELKEQLLEEKEVSEYLSKYFLKEKQERLDALGKLQEIEKEKDELKIALDEAVYDRVSLDKELVRLKEELEIFRNKRKKLAVDITDMEKTPTIKLTKANLLRSKAGRAIKRSVLTAEKVVELPPIVVKAGSSVPDPSPVSFSTPTPAQPERIVLQQVTSPKGLEGKIMTINEEHRFVVIDLGSDDGLEIGMVFSVHHGKKEITKIRIVGTRKQIAAADIINFKRRIGIRVGDAVRSEP